ncbi:PLP-dependent aminotransferase family protein [Pseudoalteromonas umbrosa]|uniref:aminotransferase-like domain-containing protein n=1 Tax=Pseudoalteromonas umbrosa TaxID=3048489 RepID=UPI0024C42F9B|nr:PLP-dependent aminotransferase family protein [Pseudoalteromonas sp. B95]MDK1287004.1 PLP-dependent aminotransferase family protein [Pseudoalteromonas sp. B95]
MKQLEVMNFLNEVSSVFPDAISLASGRPSEKLFEQIDIEKCKNVFLSHYANKLDITLEKAHTLLLQYGPSAGIIRDLLSVHLKNDESIDAEEQDIIVTNGCQEALTMWCLNELKNPNDCVLTFDPSYIGLSGFVEATGKAVFPITYDFTTKFNADELSSCLDEQIKAVKSRGFNPKAIYVNGDFNNPLAYNMTEEQKSALLDFCFRVGLQIIEDNPYGLFSYLEHKERTMKSLDKHNIVYYIGSFSKSICPALRVGYLVVPKGASDKRTQLVALKSLISVNTSQVCQAVVGGYLLQNQVSLLPGVQKVLPDYKRQRDAIVAALDTHLSFDQNITWNIPQGGFFIVLQLPISVSEQDVYTCAQEFGVIIMPVSFFSLDEEYNSRAIRLAFSNLDGTNLTEAVKRLAGFLKQRIQKSESN